jgi:hypothetical protein
MRLGRSCIGRWGILFIGELIHFMQENGGDRLLTVILAG